MNRMKTHRNKAFPKSRITGSLQNKIQSIKGKGEPLPGSVRDFFKPRFNKDFSQVRIHSSTEAADLARSVNARAFTFGKDIVFGAGQYSTNTTGGKRLLAHELTHVAQQQGSKPEPGIQRTRTFGGFWSNVGRSFVKMITFGGVDIGFSKKTLLKYLEVIKRTIENDYDSDLKARNVVRLWKAKDPGFKLTPIQKVNLIKEMLEGWTSPWDENAILNLLNGSSDSDLKRILSDSNDGISYNRIKKKFSPGNAKKLELLRIQRIPGTNKDLEKGTVKVLPQRDPFKLTDAEIKDTKEYKAYMNKSSIWQSQFKVTSAEALLACRLILAYKKTGKKVKWEIQALDFVLRARKQVGGYSGYVFVGAAVETSWTSIGKYGKKIFKILENDRRRRLSIRDAARQAAEDTSVIGSPTMVETGDKRHLPGKGRKLAFIVTNSNYGNVDTNLDYTRNDGIQMRKQLKARGFINENITWRTDRTGKQMEKSFNRFIAQARLGDDVVIFYSGHGETKGMKGVDGKFVSPSVINAWNKAALEKGFQLTIIVEACYSGAITDFIRKKEITRIQNIATARGSRRAMDLAEIAMKLQNIKDKIAKLELNKHAVMRNPLVTQFTRRGTLQNERQKRIRIVDAAWRKELPQITRLAAQVRALTRVNLTIPIYKGIKEWENIKPLDAIDTMTNRVLDLARGAL